MLSALLIGSLALMVNLLMQIVATVAVILYLLRLLDLNRMGTTLGADIKVLSLILLVLFTGHLLQFSVWALLFLGLGEFNNFSEAFYHSVVNFTSLGYGDIVMSPKWRLLGALEAANGILMFGLSTGSFIVVMNRLFGRHKNLVRARDQLAESGKDQ